MEGNGSEVKDWIKNTSDETLDTSVLYGKDEYDITCNRIKDRTKVLVCMHEPSDTVIGHLLPR
jgi:hypothetical protein